MLTTATKLRDAARTMIQSEMECDPIPGAILVMAEQRVGKPITKRDKDALEAQFPGLMVSIDKKTYGTVIEWYTYVHKDSRTGEVSKSPSNRGDAWSEGALKLYAQGVPTSDCRRGIILSRETSSARWESRSWIWQANEWAYEARAQRNAQREKSLRTVNVGPEPVNDIAAVAEALDAAKAALAALEKLAGKVPSEVRRVIVDELAKPLRDAKTDSILWDVAYAARHR